MVPAWAGCACLRACRCRHALMHLLEGTLDGRRPLERVCGLARGAVGQFFDRDWTVIANLTCCRLIVPISAYERCPNPMGSGHAWQSIFNTAADYDQQVVLVGGILTGTLVIFIKAANTFK